MNSKMAFSVDIPSPMMENSNKIILISYGFPKQIIYFTKIFFSQNMNSDSSCESNTNDNEFWCERIILNAGYTGDSILLPSGKATSILPLSF